MILKNEIIEFKGMPLFQKMRIKAPFGSQGTIQDFACFFYITEGNMYSYDSRGEHIISMNEAVIKNCNNYVQKFRPNENSDEVEAIAVYLYPKMLQSIFKDELPSSLKQEVSRKPEKFIGNKLIEQYIKNLTIYFEEPEALDEELGVLKLKELIMILLKSANHQSVRTLLTDIFSPVNHEFRKALEQNLFNPLSIEELAFICHMSLSKFKREFKKEFNESPARYIKSQRLEKAAKKIITTKDPISAIAYDCGFVDPTTFSANFQQKYKISPREYRLSNSASI